MFNLLSNKYKKCKSELQALQDSTTSASMHLNNSREAELIIQLDKEHSIVVLLQQQLQSLQLQSNNHLYNRSITSINITSYNSTINESYTNASFIDGLLSQMYIDQTTIKTLQLQIKLLQLQPINSTIQNNQSSINELRNQLDNERTVVTTLHKQINTLQLQLQEQSQQQQQQWRGSNQNKSSIEASSNSNNNLLKQLEKEHNTVVSLQQQIKKFQQLVPRDDILQQDWDCTSLKIVNTSYKDTNSTDELLKQLKKDRMYIDSLEQNVQALTLQIHSFHHSDTSQGGQLQCKDATVFDQLQKQLDRERNNSTSLTLQLKALKLSHLIVNNYSYTEFPYNQTSMHHLQKQLQDERVRVSSLQAQLQSLQSQINKTSDDSNTASSLKALQKKLEDKHMNVTNLQYQLQYLQSQLQQTTLLSLNKNNDHSITTIDNSLIMDSVSIFDLQKLLEDERMKNSRLVQQLQSKTFNYGNQLNKNITNITTINQFDDERLKYGALKQQVQSLFGPQRTDGDVLINSELVKQYNARIIKTANKELEKQLEDEREKSTRLERQVLSLEFQKTLLVDQVKKGFMEDIRKDAFNTASMSLELDAKKAEITRFKQLLAAKEDEEEEEITQLKQELRAFQVNPLSSSSSLSSVSALKKQHSLHPEMNEIMSTIAVTNKEIGRLIKYDPQSSRHKYSQNVIFSCALSDTYVSNIARFFAGTARNSGFSGDIIVAVLPDAKLELLQVLREYGVIIYIVKLNCVKSDRGAVIMCDFMNDQLSISLMRMFIYQYWALQYPDTTYIMMSDFRDVMFQSNPFTSKNKFSDWGPSAYDITMFSEQDPNRVINRCRHPSHTLKNCYGKLLHGQLATNTMVNNGIIFATRNASLIYVSSSLLNTNSITHNVYIYILD
jgi:hypothetical protein